MGIAIIIIFLSAVILVIIMLIGTITNNTHKISENLELTEDLLYKIYMCQRIAIKKEYQIDIDKFIDLYNQRYENKVQEMESEEKFEDSLK